MLNISVLVKPVYDSQSICWDWEGERLAFASPTFNGADLSALQWAGAFKKENAAWIRVFSVLDGEEDGESSALMKYLPDEIFRLKSPGSKTDSFQKASILARELSRHPSDLILCGSEGEDTRTGATPLVLAELLNLPCISQAYQIVPGTQRSWKVGRKEKGGIAQTYEVGLPAVIGVIPSLVEPRYFPRNPTQKYFGKMIEKEAAVEEGKGRIVRRRTIAPEPGLRFGTVPSSALRAPARFLLAAGFDPQGAGDPAGGLVGEASAEHLRVAARNISTWLREG